MGDVPSILIEISKISEKNIGSLMYFFMLGAAFSGYLFSINPFVNQEWRFIKRKLERT